MKLPTLYKEKNGKILFWQIGTTIDGGTPRYEVAHGYVGGKVQRTHTDVPEGKNIGKANETTAIQQCELEAKSEWNKHKDRKGYVENLESSKKDTSFKPVSPMLAHDSKKYPKKIVLPCYVQKKYDGICCLAHIDNKSNTRFFSRRASEFHVLGHLADEIKKLGIKDIVLHGELYSHKIEFEKITGAIKRDEPNENTKYIEYVVYDAAIYGTYEQRLSVLSSLLKPEWDKYASIKVATTHLVHTREQIEDLFDTYEAEGYEGVMLRNPQGIYVQDKRSFDLLKYKKFIDEEFEIVGASENVGKLVGTCTFTLKTKEGKTFDAMPKGEHPVREKYWQDWNKGKIKAGDIATIEYFELTSGGVPRFPVLKSLRNYE